MPPSTCLSEAGAEGGAEDADEVLGAVVEGIFAVLSSSGDLQENTLPVPFLPVLVDSNPIITCTASGILPSSLATLSFVSDKTSYSNQKRVQS